jgi:Domain of unknown function (DUF4331)
MRTLTKVATLGAAAVLLTVGAAPLLVSGADHLDAPALGGLTNAAGDLAPHSEHGDRDINDLYVFAKGANTILALTTNPAINLFGGRFGSNVRYVINVDKTGDAVPDAAYVVTFRGPNGNGAQAYTVTRYTGANARTFAVGHALGSGSTAGTGQAALQAGARAFAGVRSDPFFFDLTGFLGSVKHVGTDALGQNPTDFFVGLNTNAIVLSIPNDQLGGVGAKLGVWAQTRFWNGSTWQKADQIGRPAINTVFNATGTDKNDFNVTDPSAQRTAFGGRFRGNIVGALEALGGYDAGTAGTIANILLPDVLTFTVGDSSGFLNGRRLADDVIDVELNLVTNGAIAGDGVGAHTDYLSSFPYLGVPHA